LPFCSFLYLILFEDRVLPTTATTTYGGPQVQRTKQIFSAIKNSTKHQNFFQYKTKSFDTK
ncbi:hypothetical protein, partial [Salmonella sp. s54925]|uniref:hypothetical protein n=1 Tax=Salmonella sp. s54925 TaxID=3159674 RepID=UPI00397F2DEC